MGLIGIVAGLILLLVHGKDAWFTGQDTVGLILLIVGGVLLLLQILWTAFVARKALKPHREVRNSIAVRRSTLR